jgi:hypothetical protein
MPRHGENLMFIGIGLGINAIRADVAAAVLTPVNTGAPTFSPTTGKIGTSHTASGDTWDAYDEREYRVQVGGVTVSSSATYTPVGGDDGDSMVGQVRARNTGGAWSAWASTAPLTVTYPVAVAAGALADQSYTQGTGDQTVNAAGDFTGAVGGAWSVSGGGASIDVSGVVTIPTTSLLAGVTITVSYTNSGGVASSAFQVTVAAAATAPAQFTGGMWSLADKATTGTLTVTISSLPSNGGSAITAIQYQVDGGSWSASGISGTGTFDISGLTNDVSASVAIRAVNAVGNGTASSTKSATPTEASGTLAAVTNMTGFTKDGVTVSFWDAASGGSAKSMPVCQDALGDYAVISTSAFWFTTDKPSAVDANGFRSNGLWERPFANADYEQGFEQGLNWGRTTSASSVTYNDTLNTDPGKTGTRVAVASGANRSWVKAVRTAGLVFVAALDANPWEVFDAQVPITVLSEVPQAGFFLPDPSAPEYGVQAKEADLNYSVLRSLTPVSGQLVDVGTTRFAAFSDFGFSGEKLRRLVREVTAGNSSSNYSSDYGVQRAFEMLRLHTNASTADKRDSLLRMVRYGLWRWTQYKRFLVDGTSSAAGSAGAGQWQGYLPYIALAGFALGRSDILADAQNITANLNGQPFWATADMEGMPFYWYGQSGSGVDQERRNRTAFPQDVDQVWMSQQGNPLDQATSFDAAQRYLSTSSPSICYEIMAIMLLQNGPSGVTGEQWLRGGAGAADDKTNRKAAAIRWLDTYRALNKPFEGGAGPLSSWTKDFYDTHRDTLSTPRPARVPLHNVARTNRLTAGSGSFSYDFSAVDLTIRADYPNTQRDLRYSVDGIQFVEANACGDTGTISSAVRAKHYVQERRRNSAGIGVWSDNYSFSNSDLTERYTVTPTGTPANAAPAFTVNPKLFYKPYSWPGPWYEEATGTLPAGVGTLYAGRGYPTGASHPAPTGLYQWQRNTGSWVDISGATNAKYDLQPADLGLDVSCLVQLTNSAGTCTAVATPAASIPARPSFPADVVLDTKLDATFPLYWPTIFSGIWNGATSTVLDGALTWGDLLVGPGGLAFDKTGAFPRAAIPLGTLAAGTYRVQTNVVAGMSAQGTIDGTTYDWRRSTVLQDGNLRVQNQASDVGATVYSDTTIPANPVSGEALLTPVDVTWTHPGGPAWLFNMVYTNTGGTAKGDFVYAEFLKVTKL